MTTNSINNTASDLNVSEINFSGSTISITTSDTDLVLIPNGIGSVVSINSSSIIPSTDRIDNLGNTTNSWGNLYANGISFDDGANTLSSFIGQTSYTPILSFGGGTTGITYGTQVGTYFRIGDVIFYTFAIFLTSLGTSTGTARITLPTTITASGTNPVGNFYSEIVNGLTYNYMVLDTNSITSGAVDIVGIRDNNTPIAVTNVNLTTGASINGNGFYWV